MGSHRYMPSIVANRYSPWNSSIPLTGPGKSDHSSKSVMEEYWNLRRILSPYATHISHEDEFSGKQSPRSWALTLWTLPMVSRSSCHVSLIVFHLTIVPSPSFQDWVGLTPIQSSFPTTPIPYTLELEPI